MKTDGFHLVDLLHLITLLVCGESFLLNQWIINVHSLMSDSIITLPQFNACSNKLNYIVEQLKPTSNDIVNISNITAGQRSNHLWLQYRKMHLIASNFGMFEGVVLVF